MENKLLVYVDIPVQMRLLKFRLVVVMSDTIQFYQSTNDINSCDKEKEKLLENSTRPDSTWLHSTRLVC